MRTLRPRQRLGKYRIEALLGHGGHANVYRARDEIEGLRVALKVPHQNPDDADELAELLREVRIGAGLEHPNILAVKNAEIVDGRLVVAYRLGKETLEERLERRLATATARSYALQLLDALAFAHESSVIHCDVKPANLILMVDGSVRLTDFGIARAAARTIAGASGSGTVGYMAPEQAFGRPSRRSDVFSAGLLVYEMLTLHLPEWPFEWPFERHDRLRSKIGEDATEVIHRSVAVNARSRYADAGKMLAALRKAWRAPGRSRRRSSPRRATGSWRDQQAREYRREFGAELPHDADCRGCGGPLSAAMTTCPWCGVAQARFRGRVRFPRSCRRCGRGRKLDWRFCCWCWGAGFADVGDRSYTDKRYTIRCSRPGCRQQLMPFMRYCPGCHAKTRRPWPLAGGGRCPGCGWGVAKGYWSHCAWCAGALA